MKKIFYLVLCFGVFICNSADAAVSPAFSTGNGPSVHPSLLPEAVVNHNGSANGNKLRRPPFLMRVKGSIAKGLFGIKKARADGEPTERQKKQGKISMILGIASVVLIFIPTIGFIAIPAAITALVLGIKSAKGNANTQGIVGIVTGSVTLFFVLLALIYIAAWGAIF